MPQVSLNFGIRHIGLRLFVLQAYENILCFSVSHIYVMQAALLSANRNGLIRFCGIVMMTGGREGAGDRAESVPAGGPSEFIETKKNPRRGDEALKHIRQLQFYCPCHFDPVVSHPHRACFYFYGYIQRLPFQV